MSEWGSFASEFIACERCFNAVGEAFKLYAGRGTIEPQVINKRIYAGYCSGLYSGEEHFSFDCTMRELIEPRICHPVQIAVMCEAKEGRAILTYTPHSAEDDHAPQQVENLSSFIWASMYGLRDSERADVIRSITSRYCLHCGTSNEPSSCQCWNDD